MVRDNPLEDWLFDTEIPIKPQRASENWTEIRADLDHLQNFLAHPVPGYTWYDAVGGVSFRYSMGLPLAWVTQAQEFYRVVYQAKGRGILYAQESLLTLIAHALNPVSVPFWLEILNYNRPRDIFIPARRDYAVAALALLVIRQGTLEAFNALRDLLYHPDPDVRALAVYVLGQVYLYPKLPLPMDIQTAFAQIAVQDTAFKPRFQARAMLRECDFAVPLDNPGGVYVFKVRHKQAIKSYRVIELRSEQDLDDLHVAIQRAFSWNSDHLYSFFMTGKYDPRYTFACQYEETHPPWTHQAVIGELGLGRRHKFVYLFDYGDQHEFEIEVTAICPQAGSGDYPRVVKSVGKAPDQYRDWL